MKSLILAIVATVIVSNSLSAQSISIPSLLEPEIKQVWFNGVVVLGHTFSNKEDSSHKMNDFRLFFGTHLADKFLLGLKLTPIGPHRIQVRGWKFTWRNPVSGVCGITVGRFKPPFGWDLWAYQKDTVPTINFSSISDSVARRNHGIEVEGGLFQRLSWRLAVFSGNRSDDSIEPSHSGWSFYMRPRLTVVNQHLWIGASSRLVSRSTWGADLQVRFPLVPLNLELETIPGGGSAQFSALGAYSIHPVTVVFRFERLSDKKVFTPGLSLLRYSQKTGTELETRVNVVFSDKDGLTALLLQTVGRW